MHEIKIGHFIQSFLAEDGVMNFFEINGIQMVKATRLFYENFKCPDENIWQTVQ